MEVHDARTTHRPRHRTITLLARTKAIIDERTYRARAVRIAELDAYREAGWEYEFEDDECTTRCPGVVALVSSLHPPPIHAGDLVRTGRSSTLRRSTSAEVRSVNV
ncbi:hypothetical protein QSJ18_20045 [Gordonia sp. ABSL1-1]|uniref:hypothetical protein n=1 Tax=Gordonia sp. ABSL1-1 TaxID=3053923 RepID=UPI0025730E1A|nr:hypothetical protein [Gordonia sp. ABSL1-1]MDL9939039.1 hypothetical protein [Gordonia sp. ABSL1-1]